MLYTVENRPKFNFFTCSRYPFLSGGKGVRERKKLLSPWPVPEPKDYVPWLNHPQPKEEIENIRYALKRSRPYGSESWVAKAVAQFGLENTLRNPWRPEKGSR